MDNGSGRTGAGPTVPAMSEWRVPGYDDLTLLGFGSGGELWRARAGGGPVALRRLVGGRPEAVREVRALATVLRSLPSPHLIRVRTTLRVGGDDVLVLDLAEGGSLCALMAARGTLSAGEVVTAVAPLAEVLGQAHAHGLVHGRLTVASVLLAVDGMPLLDGVGLGALHDLQQGRDPSGAPGVAADVRALGTLCCVLLTGGPGPDLPAGVPEGLRRAVASALDPDPARRPSAADLGAALLAACPATPLRGLVPPAAAGGRSHRRPARSRAPLLAGMRLGAVVLAVVGAGWAWGSRDGAPQPDLPAVGLSVSETGPSAVAGVPGGTPAAAPAGFPGARPVLGPVAPDWREVVDRLDAARGLAFARADVRLLAAVWSTTSRQAAADADAVTDLARRRRTASGVRHRVVSVRLAQLAAGRADLVVGERLGSYLIRDGTGRALAERPAASATTVRMTVRWTALGWRVEAVGPVSP